jgi:hypothetical protein
LPWQADLATSSFSGSLSAIRDIRRTSSYEGARDLTREIAKTEAYRTSRRQRKKVEMLFGAGVVDCQGAATAALWRSARAGDDTPQQPGLVRMGRGVASGQVPR